MLLARRLAQKGLFSSYESGNPSSSALPSLDDLFRSKKNLQFLRFSQCTVIGVMFYTGNAAGDPVSRNVSFQVNAPGGSLSVSWDYEADADSDVEVVTASSIGETSGSQYLNRPATISHTYSIPQTGTGEYVFKTIAISGINYLGQVTDKLTESFVGGSAAVTDSSLDAMVVSIVDYSNVGFTLGVLTPYSCLRRVIIPNLIRVEKLGILTNMYMLRPLEFNSKTEGFKLYEKNSPIFKGHPLVLDFSGNSTAFMTKTPLPARVLSVDISSYYDPSDCENLYVRVPLTKAEIEANEKFPINTLVVQKNLRVIGTDGYVDYGYNAASPYDGTEDIGSAQA